MKTGKIRIVMLVCAILIAYNATSQIGVRKDSYLEDVNGKKIDYQTFVSKMDTGKYSLIEVKNEDGKAVGYRLVLKTDITMQPTNNYDTANMLMGGSIFPERSIGIDETIAVELIHHNHLLIPLEFINKDEESKEGWVIFDTGTFVPLIITDDAFRTDLGQLKSVSLNGFKINLSVVGGFSNAGQLAEMADRYEKELGERLRGKPIVGMMGFSLLKSLSVTIDVANKTLILGSNDKAVKPNHKIDIVNYEQANNQNIWIPVEIDNQKGYVHLDTGYPYTWIEETYFKENIKSYKIGDYELSESIIKQFIPKSQQANYNNIPFKLLGNIGNDFLTQFVVSINSKKKTISIEQNQ